MKKSVKIIGLILLVIIIISIALFKYGTSPENVFKATINRLNHKSGKELPADYFIERLRYIVDTHPESIWADDAQRIIADLYSGWNYEKAIEEKRKIIAEFPDAKWEEWTLKNSFNLAIFRPLDFPADALAQFEIVFIYYYRLKDYQKAIEEGQKAIAAFPDVKPSDKGTFGQVVVCYHTIAKSYKALGDLKKAEETYQTIIDRFPNTKAARIAQDRIKELKSQS